MKLTRPVLSGLAIAVCLFVCSDAVLAQEKTPPPNLGATPDIENMRRETEDRQRNQEARSRNERFLREVKEKRGLHVDSKTVFSEDLLFSSERKLLEPAAEDRKQYAAFLSQPETGIFKLLVAERSSTNGAVSVEELKDKKPALSLFGGGAFYSFTKRKHDVNEWIDLSIANGKLKTGVAVTSLGAMTIIGDVPLDLVKTNSVGVSHLAKFVPPADFVAADKQFAENSSGYEVEGLIYKSTMPIVVNQVYALRSTIYKRSDLLIVFRVIRQDKDGALTILWKKLDSYVPPKIVNIPKEKQMWIAGR